MEFELIHFPDFQNSFFGKEHCSSILEACLSVRQRLSCRHLTHITPRLVDNQTDINSLMTVISTAPANWVANYAAKNYFKIDPLFHHKWTDGKTKGGMTISEIYNEKQVVPALQGLVDDIRAHRLGNNFIIVTHDLSGKGDAHTIFTFENNNGLKACELIRLLEKELLQASAQLHETILSAVNNCTQHKKEVQSLVALTPREMDCLKWAARGKTDGEIAEILHIARWTVVTYLQNAKIKLGCANRTSAVAVAMSLGIIPLPDISHLQI
ncbi:LuxR C-terminal-related transcriptional regulator [Pseudochrobactrum sp. MP213Fo]|uniref:helix-turn-helix transcriptional regulator n=1 Tax=Pseudochrobactrum sp. MP213Fo TaxID=3022250 RepID=UPI003B9FE687